MQAAPVEISGDLPQQDLAARILSGEVVIVRDCLGSAGLMEEVRAASLEGIGRAVGSEVANQLAQDGFETIHDRVGADQIPAITDSVYAIATQKASSWLARLVPAVFGPRNGFYFEREPNVRFLIPHARTQEHRAAYREFAKSHGEGKITAHGPHRDSWFDCPDNVINIWIAVGPVRPGNGLSVFTECYRADIGHTESGDLAPGVNPGTPFNFDLAPGDAILFHGDQLHASELNRIDETRHALSFRVTTDKPNFPNGHYHHYVYAPLAEGPAARFAELPANLAWSWVTTRVGWIRRELRALFGLSDPSRARSIAAGAESSREDEASAEGVDVSDLEVGDLRPLSASVCVARVDRNRVVAFARKCPHEGADLAQGRFDEGALVCPWHNLRFDLSDGKAGCAGLQDLRLYPLSESDGRVKLQK
jgi:nitrite reductase/ring-hydroxylating ferredoxin subunit